MACSLLKQLLKQSLSSIAVSVGFRTTERLASPRPPEIELAERFSTGTIRLNDLDKNDPQRLRRLEATLAKDTLQLLAGFNNLVSGQMLDDEKNLFSTRGMIIEEIC